MDKKCDFCDEATENLFPLRHAPEGEVIEELVCESCLMGDVD